MPELRHYRRFGRWYMLANAASVLPFLPVLIFIWHRASIDRIDAWFWLGVSLFVAGAGFGLWWQAHRSRRMRCPQCRTRIVRSSQPGLNDPINFICPRCELEWVTGLRVSDD